MSGHEAGGGSQSQLRKLSADADLWQLPSTGSWEHRKAACGLFLLVAGVAGSQLAVVIISPLLFVSAYLMVRSGRPKQHR